MLVKGAHSAYPFTEKKPENIVWHQIRSDQILDKQMADNIDAQSSHAHVLLPVPATKVMLLRMVFLYVTQNLIPLNVRVYDVCHGHAFVACTYI